MKWGNGLLTKSLEELVNEFQGYDYFYISEKFDNKVLYIPDCQVCFIAKNWIDLRLKETSKEVLKSFNKLLVDKVEKSTNAFFPSNLIEEVIDLISLEVGEAL